MMGMQTRTGGYYFPWRTNPISQSEFFLYVGKDEQ